MSTQRISLEQLDVNDTKALCSCWHNSLVGARTNARVTCSLADCFSTRIFWIIGIANTAVLPDPVLPLARTSLPSRIRGIPFSWIRVGVIHPCFAMALRIRSSKFIWWNPTTFFSGSSTSHIFSVFSSTFLSWHVRTKEPSKTEWLILNSKAVFL